MKIEDKPALLKKFQNFFTDLETLLFEETSSANVRREMEKEGFVPFLKKKHTEPEKMYERKFGKRKIFICTSFNKYTNDINKEDYIWMGLKTLGNPIKFFWFPLLRSLYFDGHALENVEMFIEIILKWPLCDECGEELLLVHYPGVMHLMEFVCGNHRFFHQKKNKVPYAVFDIPDLSDKNSLLMFNRYQKFYEYEYKMYLEDPDKKHQYARVLRANRKYAAKLAYNQKKNQFGDIKNFSDGNYDDGPHNDGEYGD